ncbi:MAG: hypothetical protein ACREQ5_36225 [Candidatus Dormibacteria bacterium]
MIVGTVFPRCPYVLAGHDVVQCPGYAAETVDFSDEMSIGLTVTAWETCRFLRADRHATRAGYYPACHHPGGVPVEPGTPSGHSDVAPKTVGADRA